MYWMAGLRCEHSHSAEAEWNCSALLSMLYALPFVANRILPEVLGHVFWKVFAPRHTYKPGKFRAYYLGAAVPPEPYFLVLRGWPMKSLSTGLFWPYLLCSSAAGTVPILF